MKRTHFSAPSASSSVSSISSYTNGFFATGTSKLIVLLSLTCLLLSSLVVTNEVLPENYCRLSGIVKDTLVNYEKLDNINEKVFVHLKELMHTEFFRYYKLDLNKECPFWPEPFLCTNRDCSVKVLDNAHLHLREHWEEESHFGNVDLGKLTYSSVKKSSPFSSHCDQSDSDFCVQEDLDSESAVYVDLIMNPERFTGYSGDSSWRVWKSIYEQNCFKFVYGEQKSMADITLLAPQDDVCLEKRAFYKVVSGLHSSISTHLCEQWLNKTTGTWQPNLDCFHTKVAEYPDRLKNMYFLYTIIAEAVASLKDKLHDYTFCHANKMENMKTKSLLENIFSDLSASYPLLEEDKMFNGNQMLLADFKLHFRNISRIMDCVGCEKCRLWGKIQISGIGTAMKILFSNEETDGPLRLRRSELVALFNAYTRIAESIDAVEIFRNLYKERWDQVKENERNNSFVSEWYSYVVSRISSPTTLVDLYRKLFK